jgi:hypothetical protein
MAKKQTLRSFLRSEVMKHRIKPPSSPKGARPGDSLEGDSNTPHTESHDSISESNSLFGDPVIIKQAKFEKRLQDFLSHPPAVHSPFRTDSLPAAATSTLQSLKDELKDLVYAAENASPREKELIQSQRAALVEEINHLEEEADAERVKQRKGTLLHYCIPLNYISNI